MIVKSVYDETNDSFSLMTAVVSHKCYMTKNYYFKMSYNPTVSGTFGMTYLSAANIILNLFHIIMQIYMSCVSIIRLLVFSRMGNLSMSIRMKMIMNLSKTDSLILILLYWIVIKTQDRD